MNHRGVAEEETVDLHHDLTMARLYIQPHASSMLPGAHLFHHLTRQHWFGLGTQSVAIRLPGFPGSNRRSDP